MLSPDMDDNPVLRPVRVNFNPLSGYIIIEIDKKDYGFLDRQIRYQSKIFQPKRELHITITSQEAAEQVRLFMEKEPEEAFRIQSIIDETPWSIRKQNVFYHVTGDDDEETIIQMVEVIDLLSFFSRMSKVIKHGFVLPPAHVTLYTFRSDTGIGLATQEEFDRRVKTRVTPEELQPVNPTRAPGADQGLVL